MSNKNIGCEINMNIEKFKKECYYKKNEKSILNIILTTSVFAGIVIFFIGFNIIGHFLLFIIFLKAFNNVNEAEEYNKKLKEELDIILM